jgi:hypothetical protein
VEEHGLLKEGGNSEMCEASRDSKHCTLKLVPFPEHTFFMVSVTTLTPKKGSDLLWMLLQF